jgi:hypothetical protein
MKIKPILLASSLLLAALACRVAVADAPSATAALQGDGSRPAAAHWVRSELYFGTGPVDLPDPGLAETRWRAFLDREVTPRFPDGFTVLDGYGQWLERGKREPERLRSKVLVILREDTAASRAALDEIRRAWKERTGDKSVLLATTAAEVSF